jgi:hypothetical protein
MGEDAKARQRGLPRADGRHDFEELRLGNRGGESRCRTCGALADEIKVDGRASTGGSATERLAPGLEWP